MSAAGAGRTALITGCSSGIGRATALRLDRDGWTVYAGVRKNEDAESLAADGSDRLRPLIVDITDSASIDLTRERIQRESGGGLDGLVNNAGVAYSGPLEFIPIEDFRRQLEVNLIGHVAVTQAMIPALRTAQGRIVNVTSIGGIVTTPFFSPYNASKFGLEAVSDSLRVELRPWGIKTIAIEPGSVATEIWEGGAKLFAEMRERFSPDATRLYGKAMEGMAKGAADTGARGIPAEDAAAAIERALTAKNPRARYLVGRDAKAMAGASRVLPAKVYDRLVARSLKLP